MIAAPKEFGLFHLRVTVVPVTVGSSCKTKAGGPGSRKEDKMKIQEREGNEGEEKRVNREWTKFKAEFYHFAHKFG